MVEITIRKRQREEEIQPQKKFFRKTRKGRVIKVLRERYLRDDIGCGVRLCPICASPPFTGQSPSLPVQGTPHPSFPAGHHLLPDTNALLHQIDLFEHPSFQSSLILLQTVMDEVRHRSLPLYNRVRNLVRNADEWVKGGAWVFWNEFREETAVGRKEGESANDMNDRAIRTAAAWYASHIGLAHAASSPAPTVLLLTDDTASRQLASALSIPALSVRAYVAGLPNANELGDVLAAPGRVEDKEATERRAIYDEYLPAGTLDAGVAGGKLYEGRFNPNQYNYLEGFINSAALVRPILVIGRRDLNRAVAGDLVVVELYPESEWKAPGDEVVDQDLTLAADDADDSDGEEGGEAEHRLAAQEERDARDVGKRNPLEKHPTGRVVGIRKRNWRAYICHLDPSTLSSSATTSQSQQVVFATPVSPNLPRIRLRTRQAPQLVHQKIVVSIDKWDVDSRYPEGHFVRALGQVGSKEAEQESLLLEWEVPYRAFGRAILDCLPKEGDAWVVPPKTEDSIVWRDREDLREMIICSIDPPGCQDIDDALHARRLPNGNIEAGVHIADVSHFVLPDNAMDTEAAARGTTVYLVDKRIDMLPSLLGTNLCSLRAHVERLAFSVIWELTPEAKIINVRFTKSVIASKAAFTYKEAQTRKDNLALTDPVSESIRLLNALAKKLRAARMAAGALNLASPEVRIQMESPESSDPVDVEQKEQLETNSLVEEFMLLANISVAAKIQETFPQTAVLRRHQPPPASNFELLEDVLLKRKGMKLDISSSGALANSLDTCVIADEPDFNILVRIMATRCMRPAEYFCAGSVSRETFGHYGLASPIYTHFTSPIRRFADVLVHRQLAAAINYTPLHASLHSRQHMERILNGVNRRHRMAQNASRASLEFFVAVALKGRAEREGAPAREKAFIIRAFRNGVAVFVSKLGLEGLVTFKREINFDPELYSVKVPSATGEVTLSVFDEVDVEISIEKDVNTQRGRVIE
ncbi:RNB-domain-containing protein [Dacryopinax primogenitus]|uniref:Ribosomal RNA-processing protein 44 n=1 Tax=Dacryopinax primogenitus (strain DJM 731) TaxID=1858805 RepID=M5FW62_DACPD|nr:RNB-domain-containing protein [Dacryopinax primogenitus]EJU00604.1 RNB-domain-containing protein [Dacryopinax primogenitus]